MICYKNRNSSLKGRVLFLQSCNLFSGFYIWSSFLFSCISLAYDLAFEVWINDLVFSINFSSNFKP